MADFTPVSGFMGGMLIGLAATVLLAVNGRIAGVSGILAGVIKPVRGDTVWRVLFIFGIWLGVLAYGFARGAAPLVEIEAGWPTLVVAGLLVGFGTRLGSGCTSGHGVCGIARPSKRSIVATLVFMLTAIATVFLTRHVLA